LLKYFKRLHFLVYKESGDAYNLCSNPLGYVASIYSIA